MADSCAFDITQNEIEGWPWVGNISSSLCLILLGAVQRLHGINAIIESYSCRHRRAVLWIQDLSAIL
jgi:hypothetical protein